MNNKLFKTLLIALSIILFSPAAKAWDIKSAVNKITQAASQKNQSEDTQENAAGNTVSSKIGGIGDLISGVASAFGFGSEFQFDDLVGTWKYTNPAVQFKSDNLLMKAGGVAAASTVEEKLRPYYKMAGCENLVLTIESDSTFTMNLKLGHVGGTITQSEDGKQIFFNFAVLQKIKLGTMEAFITRNNDKEMELTFDVSGLLEILEKIGSMSSKTSISTVTTLLKQYDGLTAGFELKKE